MKMSLSLYIFHISKTTYIYSIIKNVLNMKIVCIRDKFYFLDSLLSLKKNDVW